MWGEVVAMMTTARRRWWKRMTTLATVMPMATMMTRVKMPKAVMKIIQQSKWQALLDATINSRCVVRGIILN